MRDVALSPQQTRIMRYLAGAIDPWGLMMRRSAPVSFIRYALGHTHPAGREKQEAEILQDLEHLVDLGLLKQTPLSTPGVLGWRFAGSDTWTPYDPEQISDDTARTHIDALLAYAAKEIEGAKDPALSNYTRRYMQSNADRALRRVAALREDHPGLMS
jgi:hypothetical protein